MKGTRVVLLAALLCAVALCTYTSVAGQVSDETTYKPLRIAPSYADLTTTGKFCANVGDTITDISSGFSSSTCTADDVLTDDKRSALQLAVAAAIQLHSDRLLVQPATAAVKFPLFDFSCTEFTIPAEHKSTGVTDTDFLLYVAAGPMVKDRRGWGTKCGSISSTERPVAGAINIIPRYIANSTALTRLVAREILVTLGFQAYTRSFGSDYYKSISIRGKTNVPAINAPTALAKAREHFACDTLAGVELEDEGRVQSALPYWKGRLLKDELMALNQTAGYYTAITIAAMEDLGYYKGNYSNAEDMSWGRNAGCNFVTQKCVTDGQTSFPSMFCTGKEATLTCTSDRLALGTCDIVTQASALPPYFQYFANDTTSGALYSMDYCPVIAPSSSMTRCSTTNSDMPASVFGATSRCLDATGVTLTYGGHAMHAVCADIQCDAATRTYKVRLAGGTTDYQACTAGATLTLSTTSGGSGAAAGMVTCPPYAHVCSFPPVTTSEGTPQPQPTPSDESGSNSVDRSVPAEPSVYYSSTALWLCFFACVVVVVLQILALSSRAVPFDHSKQSARALSLVV